jgi:indolepyruvate ferredoxin oxidoreductase beta subunit
MGIDVKMSEIHGMSQRGGTVITQIKYGEKVYSPIIGEGESRFNCCIRKTGSASYPSIFEKRRYDGN